MKKDELPELTEQECMFAVWLLKGKSGIDAMILAWPERAKWQKNSLYAKSSTLRNSEKIQVWMQELSRTNIEREAFKLEEYIASLQGLALRAEQAGNYGAAAMALKTAGQASGLHKETVEHVDKRTPQELKEQLHLLRKQAEEEGIAKLH